MTMQIEQTKDYEVFRNFKSNRKLHEGNLKKLQKSITEDNLLKSKPILIDENFTVIDGKHRLEVAKRMGIPIWYQIHEGGKQQDIIRFNNAVKSWGIPDYLNFYSQNGHENYVELDKFIEKNKVDVNIALHLLNPHRDTGFYKDFKEGNYQFPDNSEYLDVVTRKQMVDETVEFIKKKTSGNKVYLDRVTFYCALVAFFSKEHFQYEVFMKKLQYKLDLMRPCSKKEEYLKILKDIYNWKNHSPIENI
jgi:hypothetical protein